MNVGALSEVVTIQSTPTVADQIGGQTEGTPVNVAVNVPASVESLGIGSERLQVGQLRGAVSKLVRLRYREDITDAMTVLWRGLVLEIGQVDLKQREQETHLYCAVVNA